MKKLFIFLAAILLVAGMSFGQTQTFNFNCTVQKYIEVNPAFLTMGFSINLPPGGYLNLSPWGSVPALPSPYHTYMWSNDDAAYANCPFTITYAGNNGALDGLPILARQEVPTGNGWDRLQTQIEIWQRTNVVGPDGENHNTIFISNPEGLATGTWTNGPTVTFNNAPHDGEIKQSVYFDAALPHKSPDFGPNNTWNQSADAGTYTCQIVATFSAL